MANNEGLARAWGEGYKAGASCTPATPNPYRMPPADECNRCGLPADRFSSFGEDYYRHADGTVHERVYS